jgi:hypothetical protein
MVCKEDIVTVAAFMNPSEYYAFHNSNKNGLPLPPVIRMISLCLWCFLQYLFHSLMPDILLVLEVQRPEDYRFLSLHYLGTLYS